MNDDRAVVCPCSGTTIGQIKRKLDKGITDLDTISQDTGACSGCGACDTEVMALIADYMATRDNPGLSGQSHVG